VSGLHEQPQDATPLTAEEREGLIPAHVALRRELNELEQQNILTAATWALRRRRNPLDERFAKGLHRRMFGEVWKWAGDYRTSDKNIGCPAWQIQTELHRVFGDVAYWIEHRTFETDEIAVRFHHGTVLVHPFANGNGRWSRLMADLLLVRMDGKAFGWGNSALRNADDTRRAYIDALRSADRHDFAPLIAFVRS
jgi:Fic-DOC domain mobile mystery protein B